MSFFDQIGRKLSDVGQEVVQQSKNLTDTARINGSISEKKREISRLMQELGQNYYLKHKADPDCEEQTYIDRINTLSRSIAQLQTELERIKNITTCSVCGVPIADDALFCTSCGTPVTRTPVAPVKKEAPKYCTVCGKSIDGSSLFCCHCGADLRNL